MKNISSILIPNEKGFYGDFGGSFLSPELQEEFAKIEKTFYKLIDDKKFNDELDFLLKTYAGRPSPISFASNLSKKYGCKIYLKREDLNHTGAHKINHSIGECLLAKYLGKRKVIAETGAGQHGLAIATASALLGLECDIYMGEVDIEKEAPNVSRMKILGAKVVPVKSGTRTLKEAVDEAFVAYMKEYKTAMYAIGSVVGPHPFPFIVAYFQSVVGREARLQMLELQEKLPDCVIACVGGGSNAMGIFSGFVDDKDVKLIGVEPIGRGENIGDNAASITFGKSMIEHGFKSLFLQEDGKVSNCYSVASGLNYPGVGPQHCFLKSIGRAEYKYATDTEAVDAFYELSKMEGIITALESSHAIAYGLKLAKTLKPEQSILINVSGRGDKDIDFVMKNYKN